MSSTRPAGCRVPGEGRHGVREKDGVRLVSGPSCPHPSTVLAYMTFPREHRQKLHSTNPIERLMPRSSSGRTPSQAWSEPSFSTERRAGPSQGDT